MTELTKNARTLAGLRPGDLVHRVGGWVHPETAELHWHEGDNFAGPQTVAAVSALDADGCVHVAFNGGGEWITGNATELFDVQP